MNGNGKLTKKHWTYIGICAAVIATAGAWQGGKYLFAQTVDPYVRDTAAKVHDSLEKPTRIKTDDLFLAVQKTQTYIEVLMNEETRNVAESEWGKDSALIRATLNNR